jgi:hypothetical protein
MGLVALQEVGEVTVSATVAVAVVGLALELVPVMVTVEVPAAAEPEAVKVSKLEPMVGLGVNEALTPLGRPELVRVTAPLKELTSVTVMVSVPLAPCAIDREEADGASLKLPGDVALPLQATPLMAKLVGTELVVPFHVPLNPNPV